MKNDFINSEHFISELMRMRKQINELASQHKIDEEKLIKYHHHLEKLEEERTAEITRLTNLNMVGEMAASVAHEIRNPLTTVRGFLQLLSHKKECNQYKEYFSLMIDELDTINAIITEYLSMSKNRMLNLRVQNLNQIIESLFPLLLADAFESEKIIIMKLEDIPDLPLDDKEICKLIINLVRNGLEAMSTGKKMTLHTFLEDKEVVLSVHDQGKGIDSDILNKLGTPFFTTKENGTGLGLPICYSIAAKHNATINVETGSTGTTFFVRFKL